MRTGARKRDGLASGTTAPLRVAALIRRFAQPSPAQERGRRGSLRGAHFGFHAQKRRRAVLDKSGMRTKLEIGFGDIDTRFPADAIEILFEPLTGTGAAG